jgi:hypothetical protein
VSSAAAAARGRSGANDCSVLWDRAQGSALGTAPAARFWVALEQDGPWGARAAVQSHLDPVFGENLDRRCQEAGGRLILIRRPGPHSEGGGPRAQKVTSQRVYLAGALVGRPWLLEADLQEPARLAQLPMDSLASGDMDTVRDALPDFEPSPGPVLMVCANSRRDLCCSVRGRPVAIESGAQRPGRVWECSHTGGHRFAPTGVILPHGQTFGRLSGASAVDALDAATRGEVPTALMGRRYDRGRSHLSAPGQAAESLVREQIHEPSLLALSTTTTAIPVRENVWRCRVSHVDGRHWEVLAVRSQAGDDLPQSCGKEPVPHWQWSIVSGYGR